MISAVLNGLVLLGNWRSGKAAAGTTPEARPVGEAHARQVEA